MGAGRHHRWTVSVSTGATVTTAGKMVVTGIGPGLWATTASQEMWALEVCQKRRCWKLLGVHFDTSHHLSIKLAVL